MASSLLACAYRPLRPVPARPRHRTPDIADAAPPVVVRPREAEPAPGPGGAGRVRLVPAAVPVPDPGTAPPPRGRRPGRARSARREGRRERSVRRGSGQRSGDETRVRDRHHRVLARRARAARATLGRPAASAASISGQVRTTAFSVSVTEAALVDQRVVHQRVHVLRMGAEHGRRVDVLAFRRLLGDLCERPVQRAQRRTGQDQRRTPFPGGAPPAGRRRARRRSARAGRPVRRDAGSRRCPPGCVRPPRSGPRTPRGLARRRCGRARCSPSRERRSRAPASRRPRAS